MHFWSAHADKTGVLSGTPESIVQSTVDRLLEGVQIIGFDWTYLYLNETAARHGQRTPGQLVGRSMMAVYPGIERTELFTVLQRVMSHRRGEPFINEFIYPSGESRWFELSIQPVPDGICILSMDITEKRLAEHRLVHAEKLEAIGEFASGVVHDFNNVLTAILGYAELLTEQIGPDKPIGRDLQEIVNAGQRGATLAAQLLAFTKNQANTREPVSLRAALERLEPMLRRLISENIAIRLSFESDADVVAADPSQLEQVIVNLAVNARDAMLEGGTLSLAVDSLAVREASPFQDDHLTPGEYAVLRVTDTGIGMTPEVRQRIFEPFYTTKGSGRGTGLGLAVVQRLVHGMGGTIVVDTEPGRGSTFSIMLPTTHQRRALLEEPQRQASPVGKETILLVEDEPGVRLFMRVTLERHGYRVIEAVSAEAALAALNGESGPLDLLLTDVVLPGMTGVQLARRLAHDRPALRVVFASGYVSPIGVDVPAGAQILEKPFTARTLLTRVRRALDSTP